MINILKQLVPYKIKRKIKENLGVPSLHWSLEHLKKKGFNPEMIIDVGAYKGNWTMDVLEVFPSSKILMVDAQRKMESYLQELCSKHKNVEYIISLLSSRDGDEKLFNINETASYVATVPQEGFDFETIKSQTLDKVIHERNLPFPDFLKLDVQGHELEILRGAQKALANAEICLLEVSLLNVGDDGPLLIDVLRFMDENNFQAYDICQFMRRPYDNALYQIDLFFAKKVSRIITEKRWN